MLYDCVYRLLNFIYIRPDSEHRIFTGYYSIRSWCIFSSGTTSVVVSYSLYKYCLFCLRVQLGCFLKPSVVYVQLLPWFSEYIPLSQIHMSVIHIFLIPISVLYHHNNCDYHSDVFVHSNSSWTMNLGFLKLGNTNIISTIAHLLGCFCPLACF